MSENAQSAMMLLLGAAEHLAYYDRTGHAVMRYKRLPDGTDVPLSEWHYDEADRLLAQARDALCAEGNDHD